MKSDLSRNTFDPAKHFSRVLLQQGRVTLDADWNEQADILLHYLRALAADLIGPHGGPENKVGFRIARNTDNTAWEIQPGRYYVDGWMCETCENATAVPLLKQPDYPLAGEELGTIQTQLENEPMFAYLDVWERNVTSVENNHIREVALGGPDTASRAQVVCQVKLVRTRSMDPPATKKSEWTCSWVNGAWEQWRRQLQGNARGRVQAQVTQQARSTDPCLASPESRYRGVENQLYRVEIHRGGEAGQPDKGADPGKAGESAKMATFKWSRENGSVVFPILKIEPGENKNQTKVRLALLGRDAKLGLKPGDWVEIVNDEYVLLNAAAPLLKVHSIDTDAMAVTLEGTTKLSASGHPLLRRWDQRETELVKLRDGGIPIKEGEWQDLEDGVQILFDKPGASNQYRTGDYWLIPARVATGDVEWPRKKVSEENADADKKQKWEPVPQPPHGVDHHYAPLAIIDGDTVYDLRHQFEQRGDCIKP